MAGSKSSGEFNACVDLIMQGAFPSKCWSIFLSKVLGMGVILGAVGFKLPQIRLIQKKKSSAGLALSQFVLELCVSAITLSFNYHIGAPFSTYGESGFICLQNIIIVLQIRHYDRISWPSFLAGVAAYGCLVAALYSDYARDLRVDVPFVDVGVGLDSFKYVNMRFQDCLQGVSTMVMITSRIPTIMTIFRTKNVSNISRTTWGLNLAGATIRVFTTFRELPDELVLQASFIISALLSLVVILQTFVYAKAEPAAANDKKTK
eukprot:CAMPEP_0202811072 /NCGR_PEP_ID=MMETSP1389-20130828/3023_1 /ASSEMBLY_ACC=CAM_ASM_000865 /TAXON_ID=302021 /ORGANISM="Rhodomonas sp., Strain CCMP768" /LENGTH=261 /DNA_ID=CAMNT_0049482121 /DNA_START=8 /DNA_END=793 /DNA_ORIENTATION=+